MSQRETFYIVIKETFDTKAMQSFDVFEDFKFKGAMMEFSGVFTQPLAEVLRRIAPTVKTETKEAVGIIVPNRGAVMLPNHRVMSNGRTWTRIDNICEQFNAPLEIVNANA